MSSRAKLTLDSEVNKGAGNARQEPDSGSAQTSHISAAEKTVKPVVKKESSFLKKTLYLGLTVASIVIFKRKLF